MGGCRRGTEMSIVAGVGKAAGAEVPTPGASPTGRAFPKTKRALVAAVALLLALAAFAALTRASQAPNAGHSYYLAASTDSQSGAAPQHMSEREAIDAYGKLPLSFVPNEGQTDKAVRYYAQGAGYGFFFTEGGGNALLRRRQRAWRPRVGPQLPRGQPPHYAYSPPATSRQGQLSGWGRAWGRADRVAEGASNPCGAPLWRAVARDRYDGA